MEEIRSFIAFSRLRSLTRIRKGDILKEVADVSSLFTGELRLAERGAQKEISEFQGWEAIDRELALLDEMGGRVVTIRDEAYPPLLREIVDPPLVLYRKGALGFENRALAIVGSRRATPEGMNLSEKIGETLSGLGITIVSGLARGIDTSAHRGALRGEGKTIAVLGCGLDIDYPQENRRLRRMIGEEGVLLTEYGLGENPLPYHFPERNRIIAGLAAGVLVVEATERSGSLITARLGLEFGKSVMAIPGSIWSDGSRGTNALIKQGARLVDSTEDIVSECFPGLKIIPKQAIDMDEREGYIYSIIGHRRIHVDEVIEKSRMVAKDVMAVLTGLEMKEAIREVAGGFYVRK